MLTRDQVKALEAVIARNPSGFNVSTYVAFIKRSDPDIDIVKFEKDVMTHLGF